MNTSRIRYAMAALVASAMLLVACGNNGSTNAGAGGARPSPSVGQGSTEMSTGGISTASASGVGNVLVNADGFTLYYLKTDAHGSVTCTGGCAQTWPPDLVTGMPGGGGLPGQVGTISNPSGGTQLTYDGWPLYTYSGDSAPGQANGQGTGGVWHAMTPTGAQSESSSAASGSTGGGGYGY